VLLHSCFPFRFCLARILFIWFFQLDYDLVFVFSVVIPGYWKSIFIKKIVYTFRFNFLKYLFPVQTRYPIVQIPHQNYMLVKINGHPPIPKVVLESLIEYFHKLFCSLDVFAAATGQMAIYYHDGLIFNFKPQTHCTFISCHAGGASFYFAWLEWFWGNAGCEFSLYKNSKVAANHMLIRVH